MTDEPEDTTEPGLKGIDPFRRDHGGPFDDLKKERFAQARAKGGSIRASSNQAGCAYPTAVKWDRHPTMVGRIRELRQGADDFIGVSVGWILNELKTNALAAREEGQLKSSNEAFKLIYEIVSKDPEVASKVARALPASATVRDVKRELMKSLTGGTGSLSDMLDTDGEEVEHETH